MMRNVQSFEYFSLIMCGSMESKLIPMEDWHDCSHWFQFKSFSLRLVQRFPPYNSTVSITVNCVTDLSTSQFSLHYSTKEILKSTIDYPNPVPLIYIFLFICQGPVLPTTQRQNTPGRENYFIFHAGHNNTSSCKCSKIVCCRLGCLYIIQFHE